ncbi:hypothetical protein [Burkholderia thailandensis]|uniref:hypothetical protein n=1 Tax=Burkholderia thailandensis TaxID=57975 RepID=UPI00076852B0|nr:hypothetical protein [Burkholderia thailandensis]AOJ58534.1 hypothetical protein AQ477_18050 [Burkholderia thailandensis]KXF59766.1 hypothetical protein AQ476_18265 [Burkholderia thailandensis]PNE73186.1 hypothetical protein A8H37_13865 [Burkholderia thailandensis]
MTSDKYARPFSRRLHGVCREPASTTQSTLCDDVQTVFERACSEKNFEVAECLLSALETMASRDKNHSPLFLDRAYRALIRIV